MLSLKEFNKSVESFWPEQSKESDATKLGKIIILSSLAWGSLTYDFEGKSPHFTLLLKACLYIGAPLFILIALQSFLAVVRRKFLKIKGNSDFSRIESYFKITKVRAFENLHHGPRKFPYQLSNKLFSSLINDKIKIHIYGYFNENTQFYPSITEKMLALQNLILIYNKSFIKKENLTEEKKLILLEILKLSIYLEHVFKNLEDKRKVMVSTSDTKQEEVHKIWLSFLPRAMTEWQKISQQLKLFTNDQLQFDKNFEIKNFSWIEYQLANNDYETIFNYPLPPEYSQPYKEHLQKIN